MFCAALGPVREENHALQKRQRRGMPGEEKESSKSLVWWRRQCCLALTAIARLLLVAPTVELVPLGNGAKSDLENRTRLPAWGCLLVYAGCQCFLRFLVRSFLR